ncbi:MAG: T9SS type A sorting domain-containing protein [Bacteroidetes bacterium]|nr:T9SS type A sorting domain-containing protein [Bacteroidota bacterium]
MKLEGEKITLMALTEGPASTTSSISSRAFAREPGVLVVHTGPIDRTVNVEEMWPVALPIVSDLSGGTFSTTVSSSKISSTLRVSSSTGATVFSKYAELSGTAGPHVLVVQGSLANFLLSPTGGKSIPVNATENATDLEIPEVFTLNASYPNPINGEGVFRLSVPGPGNIHVRWIDVSGRTVMSGTEYVSQAAANHEIKYEVENLSSGVYLANISFVGSKTTQTISQKVVVIR